MSASPATLRRHLWRQVMGACTMALVVLVAIALSLFLAELLGDVADGEVFGAAVHRLLLLRLPEALVLTAPLALVIGLLLGLGELAQGEEFSVMRTAGVRPGTIAGVVFGVALVWSAVLVAVAGWLVPWAGERSDAIVQRHAEDWLLASIQPGRFNALGVPGLVVYAQSVDPEQALLEGVFVHHQVADRVEVIAARRGRIGEHPDTDGRVLTLFDGVHLGHAPTPGALPMRRVGFARNHIELPHTVARRGPDTRERLALPELLATDRGGADIELHRRLLPAIICVLLAPFVLPVTLSTARGRRFGSVLVAVAVYLAYSNAANLLVARLAAGNAADPAGVFALHGLVVASGIVAMHRWWRRW